MNTNTNIKLPSADELDTGDCAQGWKLALYLIPADETDDGIPEVTTFRHVGAGTPEPAWHRRWRFLEEYGPDVVGESVRELLEQHADMLVALSDEYEGSRWDGSNHKGSWSYDEGFVGPLSAWYEHNSDGELIDSSDAIRYYWQAFDWYRPAGIEWEGLCQEAGIDPDRALDPDVDLEALAGEVAGIVEPAQDERVSGTADYALGCAEDFRDERREDN